MQDHLEDELPLLIGVLLSLNSALVLQLQNPRARQTSNGQDPRGSATLKGPSAGRIGALLQVVPGSRLELALVAGSALVLLVMGVLCFELQRLWLLRYNHCLYWLPIMNKYPGQ